MNRRQYTVNRSDGFSIVEIMVATVISLVTMLAIVQVLSIFEGRKRASTGSSDAQINGGLALFTMERDIRMAGYGFTVPAVLGCTVNSSFNGEVPVAPSPLAAPFRLIPLVITKGINGLPDTVRVVYSSKRNFSVPARVITDHPPEAANFFVNTVLGIAPKDMMIAYEAGKDCTLVQITDIPSATGTGNGNLQIHHSSGKSPWDPPGGQNIFPKPDGYSTNALLFNLGTLVIRTYSIDASSSLQLSEFSLDSNTSNNQQLFSNIVSIKAQYGFDTRPTPADAQVDTWSDTVIDADGSGTAGDAGDIQRLYAARMAVVARSASMEKPNSNGTCDFYTRTPPAFTRPTWTAANPTTAVLEATAIDVSKNPDGSANADWQCYRYKVFETVIPLRNRIWSQS
jgi:type IV pilus assembly protein PilW